MRLLSASSRLLVYALAVVAVAQFAPHSQAHPPHSSGHGVNQTTACMLWAADDDATNRTALTNRTDEDDPGVCELAELTDIPLDSPPEAVETWNDGDVETFPDTGPGRSLYPPNETVQDGRFVADAYASVFAVQPSTRARLTPGDQPLYVAPNGTLLGVVEYRVDLPADETSGSREVTWHVDSHRIDEVRFVVDGDTVARTAGDRTPSFDYGLGNHTGSNHTFQLAADVSVTVERRVTRCLGDGGTCVEHSTYESEEVTVRDSIDVVEYDLQISGYRARYPNGDFGLVVYKNHPWLGHTLPEGQVRGVWRFYATHDPGWQEMIEATGDGRDRRHSPVHPLQTVAFPIESGPTVSPLRTVDLLAAYGSQQQSPELPANVSLDVLEGRYTASYGIATRTNTTEHDLSQVEAAGIVRGVEADANPTYFSHLPINRSNLTLTVVNETLEDVTVRVSLQDAETGDPVDTSEREGAIILEGRRLNTSANGTVTATLPRPIGGVSARFESGRWWNDLPGYVDDSDVVATRGFALVLVSILYELAIPVALFSLGVLIIDRFTGWDLWPLWRGLR